jgi:hypothetical protein
MPNIVSCTQCSQQLQLPDNLIGQNVRCPKCNAIFAAGSAPPAVVAVTPGFVPQPPAPRRRDDYDEDDEEWDRPRRRSRDDERYDDDDLHFRQRLQPHRGPTILTLGILGLVFCLCPLLGWILGGIAMSMGNSDLIQMARGRMDPEGRGSTEAGKVCGTIAVIVASIAFVLLLLMRLGGGVRF